MGKKTFSVRELWLKQGLELLSRKGPAALSIDLLCRKTQKSKGSFYFQFKNRNQYITELLAYYESRYPLEALPESGDTEERMKSLTYFREELFKIPSRLELAIRAWSLYDPVAKKFQDALDKKRLAFSRQNYLRAGEISATINEITGHTENTAATTATATREVKDVVLKMDDLTSRTREITYVTEAIQTTVTETRQGILDVKKNHPGYQQRRGPCPVFGPGTGPVHRGDQQAPPRDL